MSSILEIKFTLLAAMPELARDVALQTVVKGGGRYAKFPLAYDRHSIELDLSPFTEPEKSPDGSYWRNGQEKIDEIAERISHFIRDKHIRHLSLFALTRIPLLVYLGFRIGDKVPMDIYQKHREQDEGWLWPEDDKERITFSTLKRKEGESLEDIALILSLSGTINREELPSEVQQMTTYEILPKNVIPNRNLFRSRATLDTFTRTYHDLLAKLETGEKKPKCVHIFLAVPITAAIACGRGLMPNVHPEAIIGRVSEVMLV
jgi:hypothetical protein